ncbi:hypothetical protein [Catellatospora vulcania]|uniref:hypothetical protein n=1 Tax=Catellatospora vulcania TaxID=1460450 RepID=UPI0012D417DD|nr:hypothetical protein [Catellatospora vulcania]
MAAAARTAATAPVLVHRVVAKQPGRTAKRELLVAVGVPAEPRTASVFLWWLASLSERGAQRHADRILALTGSRETADAVRHTTSVENGQPGLS